MRSVLEVDLKYTVKYSPSPLGTPSGKGSYFTMYPLSRHPRNNYFASLKASNIKKKKKKKNSQ